MSQTPAAARERLDDALHRLPETIEQFEATFAELREIIAQQYEWIDDLTARVSALEPPLTPLTPDSEPASDYRPPVAEAVRDKYGVDYD